MSVEAEILDNILRHGDKIYCFNCGEDLATAFDEQGEGVPVAVLWVDAGRMNYPKEPDEPPEAYFECWRCFKKRFEEVDEGGSLS